MTTHHHQHISRRRFLTDGAAAVTAAAVAATLADLSPAAQREVIFAYAPEAVKRIYIAPDDHTDYMWTADEASYRQAFLEMLDYYLALSDTTAGNASAYQSRWNCDGSIWLWEYERNKPIADFERLIARIRSGHITVPLNALAVVLGGTPAEAVLRGMYYPGHIERRYNLRFYEALAMEDQTLPYGLGALWAGAGAKYSWKGICGCASEVDDAWDRQHDIYWWQGPDGSRILMKWNSMLMGNMSMGGYAEARDPAGVVEYVTSDASFRARYPYDVIGCFGKGWDDLKTFTSEFVTVAQQKTNASRSVIVSNELDFFQDFEATYGAALPVVSASYGNEWELYVSSLAEVSAQVKRATEKLRAAEALATLVSLRNPGFMAGREAARDLAFMNFGIYFEHCWGGGGNVPISARRDWQRRLANEIDAYVDTLYNDAGTALGALIPNATANLRFYAFNPLSWARSDIADFPYTGATPVHVVDLSSGLEVPSQIVTVDGQQKLRIFAQDVPSVGYRVYEVWPGLGQSFAVAATVTGSVIENAFYRITINNRGAITSLVDKIRGNREFVRSIGGRAMNDLGGSNTGSVQIENSGPVSVTLKATSSAVIPHTAAITLIRDSDRIDIRNDITQNFGNVLTWAFGFELANPDVWHEEVGAVIRAKLTTAGGQYAPTNNRYDWLTLNHFADIGNGTVGVTLSNSDCYYMRLGNSTTVALDATTPQISVLAGGQVDGTGIGIPNQGGDSHFLQRFALRTHDAHDPVAAMKGALEHQNPLVTSVISGGTGYPETTYSLLAISDPNILLWALKPADDGIKEGIVARVWNLSSQPRSFTLGMPSSSLASAKHITHIETPIAAATVSNGALQDSLATQQMKTYSLQPGGTQIFLPLVAGWNLIALPVVPGDNQPATVFSSITGKYDSIHAFATCGSTSGWMKYLPDAPPSASNLNAVTIQQGLWCHTTAATSLTVAGAASPSTAIPLCAGWNLVGYPARTAVPLPNALQGIAGKYSKVYTYDAADVQDPWKRYDPATPSAANDLTALQPGRGYWIEMLEPATLTVVY